MNHLPLILVSLGLFVASSTTEVLGAIEEARSVTQSECQPEHPAVRERLKGFLELDRHASRREEAGLSGATLLDARVLGARIIRGHSDLEVCEMFNGMFGPAVQSEEWHLVYYQINDRYVVIIRRLAPGATFTLARTHIYVLDMEFTDISIFHI